MDEQSKGKGLKAKKRKIEGRDYAAEETGKESKFFHMKQNCWTKISCIF